MFSGARLDQPRWASTVTPEGSRSRRGRGTTRLPWGCGPSGCQGAAQEGHRRFGDEGGRSGLVGIQQVLPVGQRREIRAHGRQEGKAPAGGAQARRQGREAEAVICLY